MKIPSVGQPSPIELLEYPGCVRLIDPDTSICNSKFEITVGLASGDSNLALLGEFDSVAQQVENDLPQLFTIRIKRRNIRWDITDQAHAIPVQHWLYGRTSALNQLINSHLFELSLHLSGLDLGKIQKAI